MQSDRGDDALVFGSISGIVHHMVYYDEVSLDRIFMALSHAARRAIFLRLVSGPSTVGDASRDLGMTKSAITKHIRVLEDAGIVVRVVEGRSHRLTLDAGCIEVAYKWLGASRSHWARHMDAVALHLNEHDNNNEGNSNDN